MRAYKKVRNNVNSLNARLKRQYLTNKISTTLPYFNYCSEVLSSASKTCLERLARQFKKSQDLRGKNCDEREYSLLENIQKNTAITTFKSFNNLIPAYLKQFFQYSTNVHGCNTRSAKGKKLCVPQKRNSWQIRTIKARAIKIWSALPASTTKPNSLLLFKTAL